MKQPIRNKTIVEAPTEAQCEVFVGATETDGSTTKIPIPSAVWHGVEAVRLSGRTNMLDRPMVVLLIEEMGFSEAARWVREHPEKYAEAIFHGFSVNPEEENA